MAPGPDGMLSFQTGNVLQNAGTGSIRQNPSIGNEKDSSLYNKGGGGVSFGGSNLLAGANDNQNMDEYGTRGSLNLM